VTDGMKKKFIFKKRILLFLLIILVIGLVVAQLTEDNLIKETDKYKITKVTLDNKEALRFELKKEISASELIEETIKIQEKENEK